MGMRSKVKKMNDKRNMLTRELTRCTDLKKIEADNYAIQIWLHKINTDIKGRLIEVEFYRKGDDYRYCILFYQYLAVIGEHLIRINPINWGENDEEKEIIENQVHEFLEKILKEKS